MKSPWIIILIAVAIVAVGFLFVCMKSDSGFVKEFERAAQAASVSTNSVVTVSAMTDFQWDKLFVFGPYTANETIHEQLGFKWTKAERTHIDSSDTFHLLVFVKDGKVVRYFKLPRTVGDFQTLDARNVFTPGNDTFEVKSVGEGNARRLNFFAK